MLGEPEELTDKPVVIYRSSAGSGKTFTLTKEYLKMALTSPEAYQRILAVTFTNKATDEMKDRILKVLKALASGEPTEMGHQLCEELSCSEQDLQVRAEGVLKEILHHYGRFSVVTIDSFFHQVIRSFAREMGLQGTFTIDLDIDKVLQEVIDHMLADVGLEEKRTLRNWLTQFAEERVEEGKSWDFRSDITSLAKETLKDVYKLRSQEVLLLSREEGFFSSFLDRLRVSRLGFENQCRKYCLRALDSMKPYGGPSAYKRKLSGPAGLFLKVLDGDFTVSDTRLKAADDASYWLTKDQARDVAFASHVEQEILPVYQALIEAINKGLVTYQSLKEVQRYFYTFGILAEINEKLQQYREDNDVMLIADLPDFLRLIIDESDTPYIYEKVGSFFDHYLIDEFQDTSSFQWNNFKPLMKDAADSGKRNLVVGDAKQSIYRWRGGDWRLLETGISEVVGESRTKNLQLDTNWRSSEVIVKFNNWFFGNMREVVSRYFSEAQKTSAPDIDTVLSLYQSVVQKPARDDNAGLVSFEFLDEGSDYAEVAVARTIELVEQLQGQDYQLRDIAILTRTQYQGKIIADGFIAHKRSPEAKADCKYDVVSSEALYLYSSHVVKMLISLLTWLNHEKNSIALSEWLYEYRRFVRREPITDGQLFADIDRWRQWVPSPFLRQKDYLKTLPLYELVESLIHIFELNGIKSELTYLQGFQDAILDFTKTQRGDIPVFLAWWENVRKQRAIQISDENDAVKVMTIHKAKGLEFPIVIIPFLSWKLDHEVGLQDEILWLDAGDHAALKRLPVVPLKYSSKLRDTFWSDAYLQEYVSAFIDSINLLYVAFTRPTSGLYVIGEAPKGRMTHVGEFCLERLKEADEWKEGAHSFVQGSLPKRRVETPPSSEYGLSQYTSESWRGKVSLQMKGAVELSELTFEAQQRGTALHGKLAEVEDLASLEHVEDEEVRSLVQHPEVRYYFDEPTIVFREYPILMPGGNYYRIDRLIHKEGVWYVIDYKTGQPKAEDELQLKRYQQILSQMGYENPQARIIYTHPITVKSV